MSELLWHPLDKMYHHSFHSCMEHNETPKGELQHLLTMTLWEWGWVGVRQLGSLGEASEADGCYLSCMCERSTAFTTDWHYAR